MPLYEYLCRECDTPSELLVRGDETPACPKCGSAKLMKLLSVPATPSTGGASSGNRPTGPCGGGCACFPEG